MRRPDNFSALESEDMSCSKNQDVGMESPVHHMMQIISTSHPLKKSSEKKIFGMPLKELISEQSEETLVPFVINRICNYLEQHGLTCKGIFRINGHLKTIECLKTSFETYGDANLEETSDIIAAANLLKMFFRELPEAIVPENISRQLIEAYENNEKNKDERVRHLKHLVEQLPEENFATLRYLIAFLTKVASHAEQNYMTPTALGIIFGPNLFRVPDTLEDIRLITIKNQIVTAFIENYASLFEIDAEEKSQNQFKISTTEMHEPKISVPSDKMPVVTEIDDTTQMSTNETHLDSDSDISSSSTTTISPNVAVVSTEFVEMTISKSVNEHLFGYVRDECQNEEKKPGNRNDMPGFNKVISKTEAENHQAPKVCILEEQTDAIYATPDLKRQCWNFNIDEDYHETKRSLERSQLFQRTPKVRKTRKNVRKSHSLSDLRDEIDNGDEDSLKENENHDHPDSHHKHLHKMGHKKAYAFHRGLRDGCTSLSLDFDPVNDRPSHPFLELHPQVQTKEWLSEDLPTPSPEPIPTNHSRSSWPLSRNEKQPDDIILSPRATQVIRADSDDSLDPNVPPSPPVEQNAFSKKITMKEDEAVTINMKQLNKKIYNLKKKIKYFEEDFEERFGYKPSHADKMSQSDIKKYMLELSKARKDVKQLKDEALKAGLAPFLRSQSMESPDSCLGSNAGEASGGYQNPYSNSDSKVDLNEKGRIIMKESLHGMMYTLSEKRRLANRPEELTEMDKDQVQDEKIAIQKSLLQYESVFGRPTSQMEKDVMRPIYDRYRNVKRLLSKQGLPKTKDLGPELEPILEHEAMHFIQSSPQHRPESDSLQFIEKQKAEQTEQDPIEMSHDTKPESPKENDQKMTEASKCNLHELAVPELLEQQRKVKGEKKRLRKILHEFETDFQQQTGHRVQREDRTPLEAVYGEYKQIKAKLRLLEALLSKHESRFTA